MQSIKTNTKLSAEQRLIRILGGRTVYVRRNPIVKDGGYTRDYDLSEGTGLYLNGPTCRMIRWTPWNLWMPLPHRAAHPRCRTTLRHPRRWKFRPRHWAMSGMAW